MIITWALVWFASLLGGIALDRLIHGDYAMPRIPIVTPVWRWIRARFQDGIDRITGRNVNPIKQMEIYVTPQDVLKKAKMECKCGVTIEATDMMRVIELTEYHATVCDLRRNKNERSA